MARFSRRAVYAAHLFILLFFFQFASVRLYNITLYRNQSYFGQHIAT